MEIITGKQIAFKLNNQETSQLSGLLDSFGIEHSSLTNRETIVAFMEAIENKVSVLSSGNQENNSEVLEELRQNNQELLNRNSELVESVQTITEENQELSEHNQSLIVANKELSNKEPKTKVIEKTVPIQLGQYQLLIDLNYFQLAMLAKVANHFAVESLFNKQAQLNPAAFVRIEGKPKDRLSQTLVNFFMGVQFNYHRGNTYLPENVLTGDFIRKKGKEYQEQIVD